MGYHKDLDISEIWNYSSRTLTDGSVIWNHSSRTLTQSKFPFWSAIIQPTPASVSVGSKSHAYIDIQPPTGETWLLFIDAYISSADSGSAVMLQYRIPSAWYVYCLSILGSYGLATPNVVTQLIITNSKYITLEAYNANASSSKDFNYGYSGFKLSEPQWSPKRINKEIKKLSIERKLTKPLPDKFSTFEDIVIEKLIEDEKGKRIYKPTIVLEKDVPLAIDEKTNHVVERYSMYCFLDDFEDILNRYKEGKLDLERSGWKKYIEKFKEEGRL